MDKPLGDYVFNMIDKDRSGTVDKKEMRSFIKQFGHHAFEVGQRDVLEPAKMKQMMVSFTPISWCEQERHASFPPARARHAPSPCADW